MRRKSHVTIMTLDALDHDKPSKSGWLPDSVTYAPPWKKTITGSVAATGAVRSAGVHTLTYRQSSEPTSGSYEAVALDARLSGPI